MTTNSDDEIKRYLKQQSQELDSMLGEGLTDYLKLGFDSRFSGLMKLGSLHPYEEMYSGFVRLGILF